ncbi:hypothetical protein GF345_00905 [Candidatus Woesearchaeota archaeon]|nr:hypothetical protein [Candidatus Woesearchaeota archaeon]
MPILSNEHLESELLPEMSRYSIINKVIAKGTNPEGSRTELLHISGDDIDEDPQYWLVEKYNGTGRITKLGLTGMVQSVFDVSGDDFADDLSRNYILHRPNQYPEWSSVLSEPLEVTLDNIYETILGLDFVESSHEKKTKRKLFEWRGNNLLARFGAIKKIYRPDDIIPEFNDTMVVSKISDKCSRFCNYCNQPDEQGMIIKDLETLVSGLDEEKALYEEYDGDRLEVMDEGFLNGSDLLAYQIARKYVQSSRYRDELKKEHPIAYGMMQRTKVDTEEGRVSLNDIIKKKLKVSIPDPKRIAKEFRKRYPHVTKLYAFAGVPTSNAVDSHYLKELRDNGEGLNRILIGIESAHDPTSRFLGKNETAEQKAAAVKQWQDAEYKVKIIVQAGMVQEGFYHNGEFYDAMDSLRHTCDWITSTLRSKHSLRKSDKVLVSRYLALEKTPLAEQHYEAMMHGIGQYAPDWEQAIMMPDTESEASISYRPSIKPFRTPGGVKKQEDYILEKLNKAGIEAEAQYEIAIQNGK